MVGRARGSKFRGRQDFNFIQNTLFVMNKLLKSSIKTGFLAIFLGSALLMRCSENALKFAPARLAVSPEILDFGENNQSLTITIKNTGQENMSWTISKASNLNWIKSFSASTGKIIGTSENQIIVEIDRSKLESGANESTIQVIASAEDGGKLEGGARDILVKAFINKNTPPTNLSLSNNNIPENRSSNTEIGSFSTTDADGNDSHTYSLISGFSDNSSFYISGNRLYSSQVFNYESKNSYSIRVRTADQAGASHEKSFTIVITNESENNAPTNLSLSNNSIPENRSSNTEIGSFSTTDADGNDSHTYSFVSGFSDNSGFNISGNRLRSSQAFDYEDKNSYSIRVRTADQAGASYEKSFTIVITNESENNAPTNLSLSNNSIPENRSSNTEIGSFNTTDADGNDSHTYSLVSGFSDNSSFNISGNRLRSSQAFNYEDKNSYSIRVRTADLAGASYEKSFTIVITNESENNAPTNLSLSNNSIPENRSSNTEIGSFSTTDADGNDSHTYSLVSGFSDNSSFNISGNRLRSSQAFDYEDKNSYSIRVRTADQAGASYEKSFTVFITDVTENTNPTVALVQVAGGTFEMGCKSGRDDINGHSCNGNESPLHSVTVSSFQISKYEITNAQYVTFLNAVGVASNGYYNDTEFGGVQYIDMADADVMITHNGSSFQVRSHNPDLSNYPVIEVSWYGANAYCKWLGGRLPTEAEWEFAARGGNQSRGYQFSGGNDANAVGWYSSNSGSTGQSGYQNIRTHPVGTKSPNELGIYDMTGNVWEWCQDWYGSYSSSPSTNPQGPASSSIKLLRGGSWADGTRNVRSAYRSVNYPSNTRSYDGFRAVLP